jgi:hypothetical protein
MKSTSLFLILAINLLSFSVFSQANDKAEADTAMLGLPGDNLDLTAVLDLFQKSKTIEEFQEALNTEKTGINNLDLNLDKKVDFIKVITKQSKNDFTFILQVDVTEKEKQDVAVILVSKDDKGKVSIQIIGDKDLYGKDFVIEPAPATPPSIPNPAYTGPDTVIVPAKTTVVIVESTPIVQYVYSPMYVPYYPPYTYAYYPPYFFAFTVMAVGIYRHNHYYGYHGGYHGGYNNHYHGGHNNITINNNYNNYNNNRNSSNTVTHHKADGSYGRNNGSSTRPSAETRPSSGASPSTRPSSGTTSGSRATDRTSPSTRPSSGTPSGPRATPGTSPSTRPSSGTSPSTRPSSGSSSSWPSSGNRGGNRGGGRSRGGRR